MKLFMVLIIICSSAHLAFTQITFPCNSDLYLSQNVGPFNPPTNLFQISISDSVSFDVVSNYPDISINGMGYNIDDQYIYGIEGFLHSKIVRLKSDGTYDALNWPLSTEITQYVSATFNANGEFIVTGKLEATVATLVLVGSNFVVLNEFAKYYEDGSPDSLAIADIAYDSYTSNVYAVDNAIQQLAIIDPSTGAVTKLPVSNPAYEKMGALFLNTRGELFGYNEDELYLIDKTDGSLTFIADGPFTGGRDGCSCPYTIDLLKSFSDEMACSGEVVTINLDIINNTLSEQSNITFGDMLPESFVIISIPSDLFGGNIVSGGIGTDHIVLENMNLPIGTSTFSFDVLVETLSAELVYNHAYLTSTPDYIGDTIWSDDPSTFDIDDPSTLFIHPPPTIDSILLSSCTLEDAGTDIDTTYNTSGCISAISIMITEWVDSFEINQEEIVCDSMLAGTTIETLISSDGCEIIVTTVHTYYPLELTIEPENITVIPGTPVQYTSSPTSGEFSWIPSDFLNCSDCPNPVSNPENDITYVIQLSDGNCTVFDTVSIHIDVDLVGIPNGFTPNNDGINDDFSILGENITDITAFRIYNRWGELIYSSSGLAAAWDGTWNGIEQEMDNYVYYIEVVFDDETDKSYKGSILLLR